MSQKRTTRLRAWLLCTMLFWLAANPPHCDLCDGISNVLAASQRSTAQHSHPVAPDSCNGICTCCGFHGFPRVQHALIPSGVTISNMAIESPRPTSALSLTIFRPPRIAIS